MKVRKGICYFPTYDDARDHAKQRGLLDYRIICYELGWAIQLRVSGPYVGPCWALVANH